MRLVEDDELALEEDVAENGESDARVALDAAEASGAVDWSVVDIATRDCLLSAF